MFSKSSKVFIKVLLLTLLTPLNPSMVLSKGNFIHNTDEVIASNNNIVTVEVEGKGSTIDKAIQKAAVNALKKVAGTFVDSKTLINNEIKIQNNLVDKTKSMNQKVRNYSQGSIQNYEVLNFEKVGSFYKVNARFDVRLAEFKTYIKELGYGSKKVKKGLFAKVMSENKESESKIGFFKKVVLPIRDAEVLDISIGDPVSAKSFIAPSRKDNETVISKGFGSSLDLAVQDAAANALTKVVGSFMDAETYLRNKIEIQNAIVKRSKNISVDVKDYSKGSITYFEVTDQSSSDGVFKVEAMVTVGLDDFNTYLNELFAFGSNVSSYSDSLCMKTFGYDGVCNKDFSFFRETNLIPDNTVLLPFQISLKEGFLENSNAILSKIKSEKIAFNPSPFSSYNFADFDPTEDHILTIVELNQNKPRVNKYVLKGAKSTLRKLNSTSRKSPDEILLYGISCGLKDGSKVESKELEIRFLDENGVSLRTVNPNCLNSSVNSSFKIFEVPIKDLYNTEVLETPWGSLYTRTDECLENAISQDFELCETQIITKRSFWLAIQFDDLSTLNEVAEVEITYE